jgi:hypothetical protein
MARSKYIYVVQDEYDKVRAAFTVKHEMIDWCLRYRGDLTNVGTRLKATRYPDGPWGFDEEPYIYMEQEIFGD